MTELTSLPRNLGVWHEEARSQLLEGQGAAEREDRGGGQPSSAALPAVRWADRKALATVLSLVGRTLWNCGDREAGGGGVWSTRQKPVL